MAKSAAFSITKMRQPSGHTHHKVPRQGNVRPPPNSRGVVNKSGRKLGAR